jgi:hypothetical protein
MYKNFPKNFVQIDIVWDQYLPNSLKATAQN